MKRLELLRNTYNEAGTWGVLKYNNVPFAVTAECPDLCNLVSRSCIPEGTYICTRYQSPTHGDCWMVTDVEGRTYILFHIGNRPAHDSEGCILVAESYDQLYGDQAVLDSKHGYSEFMKLLEHDEEFHLTIKRRD